jgi:hypothetical protein
MATKGIEKRTVTVLDRLAYMVKRGMGALEFRPADRIARARGPHRNEAARRHPLSLLLQRIGTYRCIAAPVGASRVLDAIGEIRTVQEPCCSGVRHL